MSQWLTRNFSYQSHLGLSHAQQSQWDFVFFFGFESIDLDIPLSDWFCNLFKYLRNWHTKKDYACESGSVVCKCVTKSLYNNVHHSHGEEFHGVFSKIIKANKIKEKMKENKYRKMLHDWMKGNFSKLPICCNIIQGLGFSCLFLYDAFFLFPYLSVIYMSVSN